jgi:hypothetical protein
MAGYRRFCNKIYQATKFALGKLPAGYVPPPKLAKTGKESLSEQWILHRLNAAARAVHDALDKREFSRSAQAVYRYWYDDVCDVFIVSFARPALPFCSCRDMLTDRPRKPPKRSSKMEPTRPERAPSTRCTLRSRAASRSSTPSCRS